LVGAEEGEELAVGGGGAVVLAAGTDIGVADDVFERDAVLVEEGDQVFYGRGEGVFFEGLLVGVEFPG
jgi:hypothetical protein